MITTTKPWAGAIIALGIGSVFFSAGAGEQKTMAKPHDLLVWAGDRAGKGNDFLIVINADPGSADYGHMITTLATDQQTVRVHHTEYTMPASGMLFANDHDVGRTFIFDVRNPLQQILPVTCTLIHTFGFPTGTCSPLSSTLTTAQYPKISGRLAGWWKSTTQAK
jgi:hypothetical protein